MDDSEMRSHPKSSIRRRAGAVRSSTRSTPSAESYATEDAARRRPQDLGSYEEHLEYWLRTLEGVEVPLELSIDRPRQHQSRPGLSPTGDVRFKLPTVLTKRVRNLARQQHVSLFATLLSGWAVLLTRRSGQEEVLIGTRTLMHRRTSVEPSTEPAENLIALRLSVRPDATVEQLLKQVESAAAEAYPYREISFHDVAAALNSSHGGHPPLQVLMDLDDGRAPRPKANGPEPSRLDAPISQAPIALELALKIVDVDGYLIGSLEYATELFERETIERMAASWKMLLQGMVKHVRRQIGQLGVLTSVEWERVVHRFNATSTPNLQGRLIHELFEEQVERTPTAVAVEYGEEFLTYAELNGRANQLARYLREQGVGPRRVVGLCMERSLHMIVSLLGILKAGAAYVPLDPNYPAERLVSMLEDAEPAVVLTQKVLKTILPATSALVVEIDRQWSEIAKQGCQNLTQIESKLSPRNRVYVIYTSGSTGRPKGVQMPHGAMTNLIEWHRRSLSANEGKRVLQFAALSFDVAFQEIFSTICTGGALVLLDEWVRRDTRALMQLLNRRSIQRLFVPPLVLQSMAEFSRSSGRLATSLQDVITAGEQLRISAEIVEFFRQLDGCRLHNHYGPTETHVVTALTLAGDPSAWPVLPSIGRPIANTQIYILDRQLQPTPIGVAGEIYIGGANVANGYLSRPELTAERFVDDPFGSVPQARLYRTGDLGRWRPDATLEYLGRNDDQVKIRGFRIELGEIEVQLARHAEVREVVVVAREDAPGAKALVAYVTLRDGSAPSVEALRSHLANRLPEHMMPSAFVTLDRLPQTPSGKVDRRRLPAPDLTAYVSREFEPPTGESEQILASIWQSLLRMERVGRQDNFFELGGDSLSMARMMELLRQSGLSVDVRSAFQSPTLAALAAQLVREAPSQSAAPPNLIPLGCEEITPRMLPLVQLTTEQIQTIVAAVPGGAANIQDIYPLAPLQEGLLFHHLVNEHSGDTYVIPTLLSVSSRERLDALIAAIQAVIVRHDALRTAVLWEDLPRPVQVVYREALLPVETVVLEAGRDPALQVQDWMHQAQQMMELRRAPLIRLKVAADPSSDGWYVLLQLHHIIGDNTSQEILSSEIAAYLQGEAQHLAEPLPYRNHVAYALARAAENDAEAFFRGILQDLDEPSVPFGLSHVRGDAADLKEAHETLDPTLANRIRKHARQLSTSPATLFHAAWALVVAHASSREHVAFGSVLLGRLQGSSDGQRMLGMFINTLPLSLRLRGVTAKQLVEQTRRELVDLLNHEQASLAVAQRCSGIPGAGALFTSLLNYRHNASAIGAEWISADGIRAIAHRERTNYPLTFSVDDLGAGFALTAQTDGRIEAGRIIAYLSTAMLSLLDALECAPKTKATELSILPEGERSQVLVSFNATQRVYPSQSLVHEVFERQAQLTPDAIAVVHEGRQVTYAELNASANQLAWSLRGQGMQVGEYVPVAMERSLRMLITQLAILKGGAVYLPLDPKLPPERQAFMIRDCGARRIISDSGVQPGVVDKGGQWIEYAALEDELRSAPQNNLALSMEGPVPAYVMYTSGSTGIPKGVIVPHHAVLRLVINSDYAQIGPEDCIAHCSNPTFDASTFEIWAALLNGARVAIVPQTIVLDADRFANLLIEQRVTVLWLTIGLFSQYADALAKPFVRLRYLMTGGDVVDPKIVRSVLRNSPPQHLLNAYGPTESTTFTTTYRTDALGDEVDILPIGRPISNTKVYILNPHLQPVPIGAAGEIYIGGDGVALGYLNRPELTAKRFIADPFSPDPSARLYKSGDLARWRPDGHIEFLGRNDGQVKLRGFRIELGEIEARLTRHPQVKEASVIVRADSSGDKRLVAYYVPRSTDGPSASDLRAYLLASLPEYMIPSAAVSLERLPLTANGKLDRRALPAPDLDAYVSQAYEAPLGETEGMVADIWRKLLRVERIARDDNFFELGGHSLLAMQAIVRIRSTTSIELSINTVFEFPTLRRLSAEVGRLREAWLVDEITAGGDDIEALLDKVASMPESNIQELVRDLSSGGRQ